MISEYLSTQVYFPIHTLYRQHTVSVPSSILRVIYRHDSVKTVSSGPEVGGPGQTFGKLIFISADLWSALSTTSEKMDQNVSYDAITGRPERVQCLD